MKSNYLIVLLALLASGFMGCSDDDSYDWFGEHEKEKEKLAEYVKDKSSFLNMKVRSGERILLLMHMYLITKRMA